MFYLLLGPDDYSKKQHINSLAAEKGAELIIYSQGDEIPAIPYFAQTDLFSRPKIFVLPNLPAVFTPADLEKVGGLKNSIIVSATSLDKRKKENKDLLKNKNINLKEFILPHGRELDKWLIDRAVFLGSKISAPAANELAVKLGRDQARETKFGGKVVSVEEVYSLWQADSEVQKLVAYAKNREITKEDVSFLVSENGEVDVLQITNALAEKNNRLAFELINKFLKEQTASDEKGSIIQLNALLSEQFRNVAMTQEFLAGKVPEHEILEKTGWKSGRLFVMKKIAARFNPAKILETLSKLSSLDGEIKTSQTPSRVLLDLILAQLF